MPNEARWWPQRRVDATEVSQDEASVETVNKRTEVAGSVIWRNRTHGKRHPGWFWGYPKRVDPVEFWQILGLAAPRWWSDVGSPHRYPCKTAKPSEVDYTTWREVFVSPVDNRFARKTRNRRILIYRGRPSALSEMAATKWHFILGTSTGLAASQFTTEVSVIHLDITTQRILGIPFDHRLHQLSAVSAKPSGNSRQLPFKVECRQTGLGLADQINCKNKCLAQVSALEQGTCDQGCLQSAALALEGLMFPSLE